MYFGDVLAHDCGYPLSRYTCRATRVAADFLEFRAFCRCSTGVALHPLKISVSHLPPPPVPGGVAPKFGSEKVSRYTGVSQLQLRVSRYTVQLSFGDVLSTGWLFLKSRVMFHRYKAPFLNYLKEEPDFGEAEEGMQCRQQIIMRIIL